MLAQVFRQLANPTTLARLPRLLKIAGDDLQTDLSALEMSQLVTAMTTTQLNTQRLPGYLYWHDNLSYWMPERSFDHAAHDYSSESDQYYSEESNVSGKDLEEEEFIDEDFSDDEYSQGETFYDAYTYERQEPTL